MKADQVQIEATWKQLLAEEFEQPYFSEIRGFLVRQKQMGKIIYPPGPLIFNAFNLTPFTEVKVVILGQDPYHGAGQAHGLCFSVPAGIAPPPSLQNIFKELENDVHIARPSGGNLERWAAQGVLLLNATLTVNAGEPNSHAACGWQTFTDAVIRKISEGRDAVVFILWGRFAQQKATLIQATKHLVLKAAHPSPFSVSGFLGCGHFSKTNQWLEAHNKAPVDWAL